MVRVWWVGGRPGWQVGKMLAAVTGPRRSVPNGWIAEELKMKSADKVSQHLRRLHRGDVALVGALLLVIAFWSPRELDAATAEVSH